MSNNDRTQLAALGNSATDFSSTSIFISKCCALVTRWQDYCAAASGIELVLTGSMARIITGGPQLCERSALLLKIHIETGTSILGGFGICPPRDKRGLMSHDRCPSCCITFHGSHGVSSPTAQHYPTNKSVSFLFPSAIPCRPIIVTAAADPLGTCPSFVVLSPHLRLSWLATYGAKEVQQIFIHSFPPPPHFLLIIIPSHSPMSPFSLGGFLFRHANSLITLCSV